jgi:hypothetical protein
MTDCHVQQNDTDPSPASPTLTPSANSDDGDRVHPMYRHTYEPDKVSTLDTPHLLSLTALPTALIGEVFGFLPTPRDQAQLRATSWTTMRAFDVSVQNERFVALAASWHVITDWHAAILRTLECPVYLPVHPRELRHDYPSARIFPTAVANVKLTCAVFVGDANVFRALGNCVQHLHLVGADGVLNRGDEFISDCPLLESVTFADGAGFSSVSNLGKHFLQNCPKLRAVDLTPFSRVNTVGTGFLASCTSLTSLDLTPLSQVTTVGDHFLSECTSLTSLDLTPLSQVTTVGACFLRGCRSLPSLDLTPLSQVTTVGDFFISGCTSLTSLDLTPLSQVTNLGHDFLTGTSVPLEQRNRAHLR